MRRSRAATRSSASTTDTYWDLHEAELRAHFSPDVLFWADDLIAPTRRAARERVVASEGADRLADYWLVPRRATARSRACSRRASATRRRSSSTT